MIHPSGSVHPIPADSINNSDTIVHVSHLSDATHVVVPSDDKIWHIAIYEPLQGRTRLTSMYIRVRCHLMTAYIFMRAKVPNCKVHAKVSINFYACSLRNMTKR